MNTAASFTTNLIFLVFLIFLLVFSFKDKKLNDFVKGLIIIAFSIRILTNIAVDIFSQTFDVWSWYESELIRTFFLFVWPFGFFLLLYCFSFFLGNNSDKETVTIKSIDIKKRNIWLSFLLFIITAGIYFPFWLYRTVKDLKSNFEEIPYTPGQAVGYLFIPVFNIYWLLKLIYSLPLNIARIEKKYYTPVYGFQLHPILISLLWLLFVILSFIEHAAIDIYDSSFLMIVSAGLFPFVSLCVIFLTMQAKINSFIDIQQNETVD